MADRVSLVGLAGSMAIITHGVTMSLQSLSQLRDRYSEVDLTVLNLMAQLSTLRRVLTNIRHWIMTKINLEGDLDHQLVMDLDVSMKCCKLLVCKIGMLTGKFVDTVDDDRLDIKDLRRVIEQQTNALELLLSACNCLIPSTPNHILKDPKTRKALRQAQSDVACLCAGNESTSYTIRIFHNLTRISVVFELLPLLPNSRIYREFLRNCVAEALERQQGARPRVVKSKTTSERSSQIDRRLNADSEKGKGELTLILTGNDSGGSIDLLRTIRMTTGDEYTGGELETYRFLIWRRIFYSLERLVNSLQEANIDPEERTNQRCRDFLSNYCTNPDVGSSLEPHVGAAISSLWQDPRVTQFIHEQYDVNVRKREAMSFFDEITRIAQPGYTPTHKDIVELHASSSASVVGMREITFSYRQQSLRLIDTVGRKMPWRYIPAKRVKHFFQHALALVFFIDLLGYDKNYEAGGPTELEHMLTEFYEIVNAKQLAHSSVMVYFTNVTAFRAKLRLSPLGPMYHIFEHPVNVGQFLYNGQPTTATVQTMEPISDPTDAMNYIRSQFEKQINPARLGILQMYACFVDSDDAQAIEFLKDSVDDVMFQKNIDFTAPQGSLAGRFLRSKTNDTETIHIEAAR